MQLNIANCPRCGRVYNQTLGDVCPRCNKDIDKEYEQCANYLREHRGATMTELSEATEVSIRQITKFIREGRISIADSPNLGYPCESCGTMIREGKLCETCHHRISKTIANFHEDERRRDHLSQQTGYQFKQKDK